MKRRFVLVALVLFMGMSGVFANKLEGVNEKVLTSFQKEFVNAKEVSWESNSQFIKVSFKLNEQVFIAYYNVDGERLAIARNLRSLELPMTLQEELRQSYNNYWITDLFEFNGKDDAAYYVTIENADYRITLKSVGLTEWTTYKKTAKP